MIKFEYMIEDKLHSDNTVMMFGTGEFNEEDFAEEIHCMRHFADWSTTNWTRIQPINIVHSDNVKVQSEHKFIAVRSHEGQVLVFVFSKKFTHKDFNQHISRYGYGNIGGLKAFSAGFIGPNMKVYGMSESMKLDCTEAERINSIIKEGLDASN